MSKLRTFLAAYAAFGLLFALLLAVEDSSSFEVICVIVLTSIPYNMLLAFDAAPSPPE